MGTPLLGEIKIFPLNFAPKGWAECNGQLLPINQNQPLFAILGTAFGGNGQTNFALPDMRGCAPMHVGGFHSRGEKAGQEAHTITQSEMPQHVHFLNASNVLGTIDDPSASGEPFALAGSAVDVYRAATSLVTMNAECVSSVGGSQAHINMMPYTVLTFCIALQGAFPTQN
ncbi:MAG TPA: tail fiber protein [Pyrinomonadaceae bacterium]|jgi:microcystin-dependent protein|nr:tail fiber protein [Pyrinomonadaceae bacterium]